MVKAAYNFNKFSHTEYWDVDIQTAKQRAKVMMASGVCKYIRLIHDGKTITYQKKKAKVQKS